MIPSTVEREILIEAPIEVVWQIVTEPDQIRHWFAERAEVDLRAGGAGELRFSSDNSYQLQVEAVEPPHRFAFRWVRRPATVLRADNSMLVEFTLQGEHGHTRLRVVESGFDQVDWSDDEMSAYAEDHRRGWEVALARLRDHAVSKSPTG